MPEIRIPHPPTPSAPGVSPPERPVTPKSEVSAVRKYLMARGNSALADRGFHVLMVICGLSIFGLVALILTELILRSQLAWKTFGLSFFGNVSNALGSYWDLVNGHFSAIPFIYGTLISSVGALLISVPLAIGLAIFLTEMSPGFLRGPLAFVTELLAAIPSIIYGLWAFFILVPLLRDYVNPLLVKYFGWTGLFSDDNPTGLGYLAAAVILAIMILPIISSLTREVMTAVPHSQREAVLALGATRWEMIRMGVLRNARIGIVGAVILGLGRAIGETMAVTMVIGNSPEIHKSLLSNGASMASVIANEFSEAVGDLHRSALLQIGLALFIVTIIVNALARLLVWAVTRGAPARVQ